MPRNDTGIPGEQDVMVQKIPAAENPLTIVEPKNMAGQDSSGTEKLSVDLPVISTNNEFASNVSQQSSASINFEHATVEKSAEASQKISVAVSREAAVTAEKSVQASAPEAEETAKDASSVQKPEQKEVSDMPVAVSMEVSAAELPKAVQPAEAVVAGAAEAAKQTEAAKQAEQKMAASSSAAPEAMEKSAEASQKISVAVSREAAVTAEKSVQASAPEAEETAKDASSVQKQEQKEVSDVPVAVSMEVSAAELPKAAKLAEAVVAGAAQAAKQTEAAKQAEQKMAASSSAAPEAVAKSAEAANKAAATAAKSAQVPAAKPAVSTKPTAQVQKPEQKEVAGVSAAGKEAVATATQTAVKTIAASTAGKAENAKQTVTEKQVEQKVAAVRTTETVKAPPAAKPVVTVNKAGQNAAAVQPQVEPGNISVSGSNKPAPAVKAETAAAETSEKPNPIVIPELVLKVTPVAKKIKKLHSRLSTNVKIFLLAVLLPTILAGLYFFLWASPMYIAEARFAVRSAGSNVSTAGIAALIMPSLSAVSTDTQIVTEYIQSPDIMEAIDADMGIFKHYSSNSHDLISRLGDGSTRDEKLWYWQWMVKPSFDPETGIIALSVRAYDPETAKGLAEAVMRKSEELVNEMSRRAQDDTIELSRREVKIAEERVNRADEAMREFRERTGMLDPVSTAGGLQGIVTHLEGEITKTRTEISQASTYMSKNASGLVALRVKLKSLEKQLAEEKARLAGESKPGSMTSYAAEYEALQTESKFARKQLVSAMASLEAARVKAETQSRYVVAFQKPLVPDESLYPRPWLHTLYVFLGALVLATLLSLIIAAVREHIGV